MDNFLEICKLPRLNNDEIENLNRMMTSKEIESVIKNLPTGTSLVAQWLRIHLPMQGTQVWSLVHEDPTCPGATKPMCHNYRACALELASHNYWAHVPQLLKPAHSRVRMPQLLSLRSTAREPQLLSLHATTTEACAPRARAPKQEKPPQWEPRAPQRRVAPTRHN